MLRHARFCDTTALGQLLRFGLMALSALASSPLDDWLDYRHWIEPHGLPKDSSKRTVHKIPRERNLSLEDYQAKYEGRMPVLLEGTYDGAPCMEKDWLETAIKRPFADERIAFHGYSDGNKESLAAPLKFFAENVVRTTKREWAYAQDEFFLLRHPELLKGCPTRPPLLQEEDHFQLLPETLVPGDAFLLWGGKHSHSTLHVDPYNWTGTNLVLRGKKRWRLVPPGAHDKLIDAFQTECGFPLECVKYQSSGSLFVSKDKLPKGLPIWEGVAEVGDVLVIPTGWWHEALNVATETVAIASQVISRRGGTWSAVAEVLRLQKMRKPSFAGWKGLPKPPLHPEEIGPEAAEKIFRSFASVIPEEVLEEGRRVVKKNHDQLEGDKSEL